jgi:glycosyltransferase involved in cell wall biosynthesis
MASTFLAEETNHPAMWRWAYRHLYPRADRIICLSDAMIEDLVEHFGVPREKLVRIYNPVDTEMVRRSADAQANPYVGAGPHLVTAGRLAREKGIDILLDAMPAVLAALPGARLHVLGEGPEEAALQAQAKALGVPEQVEFLGFRQNPWPHLKHADLFILPSRYEGLPNALLEALALGTPAVAAACPGAIQEIRDVTGKIDMVPAEDAGGLAQAIVTACQRAKGGGERSSGAEDGLGRFSLQQAVEEYSALL